MSDDLQDVEDELIRQRVISIYVRRDMAAAERARLREGYPPRPPLLPRARTVPVVRVRLGVLGWLQRWLGR